MSKPVLLVHGAFMGAWAWRNVIDALRERDVSATAIDLPSQGPQGSLAADAQAVRDALANLGEPAVLVGHSYGGNVITEASADNDTVAHLVYVCAALPQEGESVGAIMGRDPEPSQFATAIRPDQDGTATLDRAGAKTFVYNDATDEQAAPALDSLGTHALVTFEEPVTKLGWTQHPSTYVLCTQDKAFSPALQREFASHTTTVVEVDSGHGPMLTQPGKLAEIIVAAAG
ncbi:alpha/beta hydrolase [Amycolatopsis sp.]|uniref:alpha/beta fold hydrolase n=1 Tax=Amycolatopsis sp. TaxID=37632 RepID=UPI002B517227|nr:alpha/beta hydrolase [Amycolatopsis sp.]HVV09314.1 alpha/beta hydrolase [Amycolatopsis sp.]